MENKIYFGITVDNSSAKFLDDAFWAEKYEHGVILRIFTPNVFFPHVKYARDYSPYIVSNLSLHPGKKCECVCYEFKFNLNSFELVGFNIFECFFSNVCRMNFDDLEQVLNTSVNKRSIVPGDVFETISLAYQIVNKLDCDRYKRMERVFRGSTPVNKREIDANGMVGLLMVLVNAAVSNFAVKNLIPFMFRCQNPEDRDLVRLFKRRSVLLNTYNGKELDADLAITADMQLKPPMYSRKPKDYWGFLLPWYGHVSSPGKRFPDFINQANIVAFLRGDEYPYSSSQIRAFVSDCNIKDNFHLENLIKAEVRKVIYSNRTNILLKMIKGSVGKKMVFENGVRKKFSNRSLRMSTKNSDLPFPAFFFSIEYVDKLLEVTCEVSIASDGQIVSVSSTALDRKEARLSALNVLYHEMFKMNLV